MRRRLPISRRLRVSLGTLVAIEAEHQVQAAAAAAVDAAFAAITEVDRRMHPHTAQSDLARINAAPLGQPIAIHPTTLQLLELAKRLNALTAGVFDPCLPRQPGRLRDIEIAAGWHRTGSVICHAPVELDFGGFAKGYAVDRAIAALMSHGCSAGLVNAGGDLRLFGPRTEPILLRHANGRCSAFELADMALAVSDADSPHRPVEHRGYYNRDARGERYAAVLAKEAVIADALTKCVLLCSTRVAERALREFAASSICGAPPT